MNYPSKEKEPPSSSCVAFITPFTEEAVGSWLSQPEVAWRIRGQADGKIVVEKLKYLFWVIPVWVSIGTFITMEGARGFIKSKIEDDEEKKKIANIEEYYDAKGEKVL